MDKYIEFVREAPTDAHDRFSIRNKRTGDHLGGILWHPAWKGYVATFSYMAILTADCLRDVAAFIEELNN